MVTEDYKIVKETFERYVFCFEFRITMILISWTIIYARKTQVLH